MFLIWSILTIPKHNIHLFPFFISLQRDDHSCWNFFFDLLRIIWFGAFQIAFRSFWSSAVRISFPGEICVFCWPWGKISWFRWSWTWSDLLDALVSCWIFSNNRRRPFRSRPFYLLNFLGSFDWIGRFCLLLCLCIILTWNPIDYHISRWLLVVHQRIYCFCISSLWL